MWSSYRKPMCGSTLKSNEDHLIFDVQTYIQCYIEVMQVYTELHCQEGIVSS